MRIVVATDGSASAGVAVELASAVRWPVGSTIRVISAVDTGVALFGGPWPTAALVEAPEIEAEIEAIGRRAVDSAAGVLRRPGIEVEAAVVSGRPATAIADEAERFGADVIIVGSRGQGRITTMLLGSVSAELLDLATVPVLIARRPVAARVVLAWDGSPGAEHAASLLEKWPVFRDAEIRVVTVFGTVTPWWSSSADPGAPAMIPAILEAIDAERADRRRVNAEMVERLRSRSLHATGETPEGDAAAELVAAAGGGAADLIVMGTRGRSGLARIALGSVARNVVSHADCSVLVVREQAHDAAGGSGAAGG